MPVTRDCTPLQVIPVAPLVVAPVVDAEPHQARECPNDLDRIANPGIPGPQGPCGRPGRDSVSIAGEAPEGTELTFPEGAVIYDPRTGTAKHAIVPGRGGPVGLFCMEAPSPFFYDHYGAAKVRWAVEGKYAAVVVEIDPEFAAVCAPGSLRVVSAIADLPVPLGAKVEKRHGAPIVTVIARVVPSDPLPSELSVTIAGLRRDVKPARFPDFSRADMEANNKFWDFRRGETP